MRKTFKWSLLAAVATLTACSGTARRENEATTIARYNDYAGAPVESFNYLGRFDGWRSLGRDKLVVWTGVNTAYLLTVDQPCPNLQFTQTIGLTSQTGSVSRGFDFVTMGHHERCRIAEIRPVDYKRLREAQRAGG